MSKKKDITKNQSDLELLCSIVYRRNSICRRRTSIRNRLYRAGQAQRALSRNSEIKRLQSQLNGLTNKSIRFEKSLDDLRKNSNTYISRFDMLEMLEKNNDATRRLRSVLREDLDRLGEPKKVPKQYRNMKASEMSLQIAYLQRDMAQVTIDQFEFTNETRGILVQLKKKYNIEIHRAGYYSRIDAVSINGERISKEDIERQAVDHIFEKEVLCKE